PQRWPVQFGTFLRHPQTPRSPKSGSGREPKPNRLLVERVVRRVDALVLADRAGSRPIAKGRSTELFTAVRCERFGQDRPLRHNPGWVYGVVDDVVVVFDLLEVHGVTKTRGLEQIASISPQRGEFDELIAV